MIIEKCGNKVKSRFHVISLPKCFSQIKYTAKSERKAKFNIFFLSIRFFYIHYETVKLVAVFYRFLSLNIHSSSSVKTLNNNTINYEAFKMFHRIIKSLNKVQDANVSYKEHRNSFESFRKFPRTIKSLKKLQDAAVTLKEHHNSFGSFRKGLEEASGGYCKLERGSQFIEKLQKVSQNHQEFEEASGHSCKLERASQFIRNFYKVSQNYQEFKESSGRLCKLSKYHQNFEEA